MSSTKNPEDHVLDAIDALVNEQLAVGPLDDYSVNRYPDCNLCPHDWHGEQCVHCSCQQSTGEVRQDVDEYGVPGYARRRRGLVPPWGGQRVSYEQDVEYDEALNRWVVPEERLQDEFELSDSSQLNAPWVRYRDQPRRDPDFHVHLLDESGRCVVRGDCPGEVRPGYTMADLERMREQRMGSPYLQNRSWVQPDYPQRYVLGQQGRPRVRFWQYNLERHLYTMIEGDAEVMNINWSRDGCAVIVRLDPFIPERYIPAEGVSDPQPTDPVPDGMIAFEGANPEDHGFHLVGHLHPDDIEISHNIDYERPAFRGDVVRPLQERYEITVQIRNNTGEP
jgi:hypothetical protein